MLLHRMVDSIHSSIEVVPLECIHRFNREFSLGKDHDTIAGESSPLSVPGHPRLSRVQHGVEQSRICNCEFCPGVVIAMETE